MPGSPSQASAQPPSSPGSRQRNKRPRERGRTSPRPTELSPTFHPMPVRMRKLTGYTVPINQSFSFQSVKNGSLTHTWRPQCCGSKYIKIWFRIQDLSPIWIQIRSQIQCNAIHFKNLRNTFRSKKFTAKFIYKCHKKDSLDSKTLNRSFTY